VSIASFLLINN